MNSPSWDRLRILRAVLETGSLAEAARRLGVSQPTVSRQVKMLEQEVGEALVDSTPDGSLPTAAGLRLAPALDEMYRAAESVLSLGGDSDELPTVRMSIGPWLAAFLSRRIHVLTGKPIDTRIEIESGVSFADLPRREADIAVRNQRPKNLRLIVKRLPDYGVAVYGHPDLVGDRPEAFDERRFSAFDWAALIPELEHLPTARWLMERVTQPPVARFSASTNLLEAVRSARVLALLPCFAVEPGSSLIRVSEPLVPDYGGHWLVMADDVRRRPQVWRAAMRLVEVLEANRELLLPSN